MPTCPEFDAFFVDKFPELVKVGWWACGNRQDAEEAAATVAAEIAFRWSAIEHPWAYARKALIREIARIRTSSHVTQVELMPPQELPVAVNACQDLDTYEGCQWVDDQLARLPEQQRAVLQLFLTEDLSLKEIADRLGKSGPSVRQNAAQARRNLREHLSDYAPRPRTSESETARKENR